MRLVKIALCVSLVVLVAGCSPVNKVRRTLALNDLHIQAAIAEDNGDDQRAYELWSEYVDRRPHSDLAEFRLGRVEMRLGRYTDAVSHLRIAHDLKPGNIEYIETLAEAMVLAGQTESLMGLLRATVNEGENGSGYLRLARYAREAGLMDEAHEALRLAIVQGRGESPEPYLAMADFARATGDTEAEIENLRYVLWFDGENEAVRTRFESLGIIPGPSLAQEPTY